jgi:hypothetical protein
MPDKVIVTNADVLRRKYGASGWGAIRKAVTALAAADRARGLTTRLVALDDAATMKRMGGAAVTSAVNCRQNKDAIDAVHGALAPDYLVILGAHDVVPHQDLRNPAYQAGDDDDQYAWGDVPYACEGPYSKDPAKFVGPTRVVSRLPDLAGARAPGLLLSLLETAAAWQCWPRRDPEPYFALSAWEWRKSTELSISNVFGGRADVFLSPPSGPVFGKAELGARCHFINCHGGESDPVFYGQRGRSYPEALTSDTAGGRIAVGTVAAAECCYGGQLYASELLGLDLPICLQYLVQGAYAYFGSTTIAYGPAEGNGAADILTQQFLAHVLDGASVGRAALVARQAYVAGTGQMDPMDLKTLAQFCVYGDASVTPIEVDTPTVVPRGVDPAAVARLARRERRTKLAVSGRVLEASKPTAGRRDRAPRVSPAVRTVLKGLAREAGVTGARRFVSYRVDGRRPGRGAKAAAGADRYHVLVAEPARGGPSPVVRKVAVVAKQLGNRIVAYRVYHAR